MSKKIICDSDFALLYPTRMEPIEKFFDSLGQVPLKMYESFFYRKSSSSEEYILFGKIHAHFASFDAVKLLKFSSESELLLTCEIYGIEVKREK